MKRPHLSLYARFAAAYLLSLLLLGGGAALFALSRAADLGRELEQRLNLHLAETLAMTLADPLLANPDGVAARDAASHITALNPSLSLYLLDDDGRVVTSYDKDRCGRGNTIDIRPLQALHARGSMLPIYGAAPCSGRETVFSSARVRYDGNRTGWLYVVLNGEPYASLSTMLRTSYVMHDVIAAGLVTSLLTAVVGLAAFALLTRRFRALTRTVERFAAGDHHQRIDSGGDDEVGRLGRAFNDMAAIIEAQFEALRTTDRTRRELVANVSHDFRTPLTSLRAHAERLLEPAAAPSPAARERLQAILANVDALTRLAEQLSLLSRIDAYAEPLRRDRFALPDVVQDVLLKFTPAAEARGVHLSAHCAPGLPAVDADLGLIDRLLSNLLDNALAAVDDGGHVEIDTGTRGDDVEVRVRDDGCGIATDEIALVTQRFYRGKRADRTTRPGSGLGLSIVREILERHGTTLHIDSKVGYGTTISFTLPHA